MTLLLGIEGFIHLAAPVGGIFDLDFALDIGRRAALNALEACEKTPSVKRFVNTSSSTAASFSKPDVGHEVPIDETTYNDEAAEMAKADETRAKGFWIYATMKSETEKAMWQWMKDHKPQFVFNSIVSTPIFTYIIFKKSDTLQLPNVNFGPVLVPEHQGYPSTVDWARAPWTGENLELYAKMIPPQWYVSLRDDALLHISTLIHSDVANERLFAYAGRFNFNHLLAIYRKHNPEKTFPEDVEGLGQDWAVAPTARPEEILTWVKGRGWDGLEETVVEMSKDW
jgi:hypothetical protein